MIRGSSQSLQSFWEIAASLQEGPLASVSLDNGVVISLALVSCNTYKYMPLNVDLILQWVGQSMKFRSVCVTAGLWMAGIAAWPQHADNTEH
jgi:hypothetical protein